MTPCEEQVERVMKKSKAREWTVWEMVERTEYSYSSVHLALKGLVARKIIKKRKLEKDGRIGSPGYGYFLAKTQAVSTKKRQVVK